MQSHSLEDIFGPVIYAYTRADALADGVLIDVTQTAAQVGFQYAVALTCSAWQQAVAWSRDDTIRKGVPQDEEGRLWDVLFMAGQKILAMKRAGVFDRQNAVQTEVNFNLHVVPRDGESREAELTTLKINCGPGDDAEPVITIMLPEET